jgi:N-methylhydantoinase A
LDAPELERIFRGMESEGATVLRDEGFAAEKHRFERLVDLRYAGANSELTLPFSSFSSAEPVAQGLRSTFSRLHEQQYGYSSPDEAIETMNLRVIARASTGLAQVPDRFALDDATTSASGTRQAYFGPQFGSLETPICGRGDLAAGWRRGPLLVEEFDSTTVVPPDGRARCIAWDTIEIELE